MTKKKTSNVAYDSVLYAENITTLPKYELTYIPFNWVCPFCKTENSTTLVEEEDLNYSQNNRDKCRKCKKEITIRASDIFCM